MSIFHLGVNIKEKSTNRISKDIYLSSKPEYMANWSEEDYPKQIDKASLNFDINMRYCESLDKEEFSSYILFQYKKHKMVECTNLDEIANVAGLYMMVLDEYKQVYIGESTNMKERIMSHWNKKKSLERLIWGDICNSILSIDSFGALDTTRVFYIKVPSEYERKEKERVMVNEFDPRYALNRVGGGIGLAGDEFDTEKSVVLEIIANKHQRDMSPYIDVKELEKVTTESELRHYLHRYPVLKKYSLPSNE